jgi:hypothetical protein
MPMLQLELERAVPADRVHATAQAGRSVALGQVEAQRGDGLQLLVGLDPLRENLDVHFAGKSGHRSEIACTRNRSRRARGPALSMTGPTSLLWRSSTHVAIGDDGSRTERASSLRGWRWLLSLPGTVVACGLGRERTSAGQGAGDRRRPVRAALPTVKRT